jgi:hypothetical protein
LGSNAVKNISFGSSTAILLCFIFYWSMINIGGGGKTHIICKSI